MRRYATLLMIALLACGAPSATGTGAAVGCVRGCALVQRGSLRPGDPVPTPEGPAALTVREGDRTVAFDMATLERLDLVEYTTLDTSLHRRVRYRGVLLRDILLQAGVDLSQTERGHLRAAALNDYQTKIPLATLRWPVMVAIWRDGQRMGHAERGPLQIVFPYDDWPIDPFVYDPLWVWWLCSLEVRAE